MMDGKLKVALSVFFGFFLAISLFISISLLEFQQPVVTIKAGVRQVEVKTVTATTTTRITAEIAEKTVKALRESENATQTSTPTLKQVAKSFALVPSKVSQDPLSIQNIMSSDPFTALSLISPLIIAIILSIFAYSITKRNV